MKLKKQLTKQEKAAEKRFNKLWRKLPHLTEAESAEFQVITRTILRAYPELFTQLSDDMWSLNEWMPKH